VHGRRAVGRVVNEGGDPSGFGLLADVALAVVGVAALLRGVDGGDVGGAELRGLLAV
jgi:hypothetical protein